MTGDLATVRENGATSGVGVLASFTFDAIGGRTGLTRGNGTSTAYIYDNVERLASLSHDLGGTTNVPEIWQVPSSDVYLMGPIR